jgi:hypothetical protein
VRTAKVRDRTLVSAKETMATAKPPMRMGDDVAGQEPGEGKAREAFRNRTQHLDARVVGEVQPAGKDRGADDGDQNDGNALVALEQEDDGERADAERGGGPVRFAGEQGLRDRPEVTQRPGAVDLDVEQFGQLADQNGEGDAVHIAVADRLGEQFGDETKAGDAGEYADQAGDDGHGGRQRHRPRRIAERQGQNDAEDDRGERRIRSEHEDAAGTEQRVDEKRDDGGVKTVNRRHARSDGISDAHRYEHGRKDDAGDDVVLQPGRFVTPKHVHARDPVEPVLSAEG